MRHSFLSAVVTSVALLLAAPVALAQQSADKAKPSAKATASSSVKPAAKPTAAAATPKAAPVDSAAAVRGTPADMKRSGGSKSYDGCHGKGDASDA